MFAFRISESSRENATSASCAVSMKTDGAVQQLAGPTRYSAPEILASLFFSESVF